MNMINVVTTYNSLEWNTLKVYKYWVTVVGLGELLVNDSSDNLERTRTERKQTKCRVKK